MQHNLKIVFALKHEPTSITCESISGIQACTQQCTWIFCENLTANRAKHFENGFLFINEICFTETLSFRQKLLQLFDIWLKACHRNVKKLFFFPSSPHSSIVEIVEKHSLTFGHCICIVPQTNNRTDICYLHNNCYRRCCNSVRPLHENLIQERNCFEIKSSVLFSKDVKCCFVQFKKKSWRVKSSSINKISCSYYTKKFYQPKKGWYNVLFTYSYLTS